MADCEPVTSGGLRALIAADVAAYAQRIGKHPGWGFWLRHLALMPGFNFVLGHRLVRAVCKVPIIGRPMARIGLFMLEMSYSSEVAISAKIGGGFYVPHPFGIVIGSDIAIGRNVMILQNVTLGRRASGDTRTPTIGDGVTIGAGAVVVGPIAIGNNATVAANALVLDDVPKGGRAIGNPARILPPKD